MRATSQRQRSRIGRTGQSYLPPAGTRWLRAGSCIGTRLQGGHENWDARGAVANRISGRGHVCSRSGRASPYIGQKSPSRELIPRSRGRERPRAGHQHGIRDATAIHSQRSAMPAIVRPRRRCGLNFIAVGFTEIHIPERKPSLSQADTDFMRCSTRLERAGRAPLDTGNSVY